MPAKLTTQPASPREREKEKHNLRRVVFSWTRTLAEIRAYPAYLCVGISGEVKAYSCSKSITAAGPHQWACIVPSKHFYLRHTCYVWGLRSCHQSKVIQFGDLKGFLKCILHMLHLKLFAIKLLHSSAPCNLRAAFARTRLTPLLKYYMQPLFISEKTLENWRGSRIL